MEASSLGKSPGKHRYSSATFLLSLEIPLGVDTTYPVAHNKVMVIDGETANTGAFKFTKTAQENNAENALVVGTENWPYSTKELARLRQRNLNPSTYRLKIRR